jgi:hypothetical protein
MGLMLGFSGFPRQVIVPAAARLATCTHARSSRSLKLSCAFLLRGGARCGRLSNPSIRSAANGRLISARRRKRASNARYPVAKG